MKTKNFEQVIRKSLKEIKQYFKEKDTDESMMIDIAKGRNIGLLKFICAFDPKTTHFCDLKDFVKIEEKTPF